MYQDIDDCKRVRSHYGLCYYHCVCVSTSSCCKSVELTRLWSAKLMSTVHILYYGHSYLRIQFGSTTSTKLPTEAVDRPSGFGAGGGGTTSAAITLLRERFHNSYFSSSAERRSNSLKKVPFVPNEYVRS